MKGFIAYLDPLDRGLKKLIGEVYSEGHAYMFFFTSDEPLFEGQVVNFEVNNNGIASIGKKSAAPAREPVSS